MRQDIGTDDAVARGAGFLRAAQDGGLWRDYDFLGPSDGWMTAYVALTLAGLPGDDNRLAATEAFARLAHEQDDTGGWAYNALQPRDADSTGWVLQLGRALGRPSEEEWAVRARSFVSRHVHQDGLVATYTMELAGPQFLSYPAIPSWVGWCAGHDCVTAAVAALDELPEHDRIVDGLLARQLDGGQWRAYWWVDQELTTALACEALTSVPRAADACRAAATWAASRIGPDGAVRTELHPEGSPFATALALRTLSAAPDAGHDEVGAAAIRWLVEAQHQDGSWTPSARLRMPFPWEPDADAHEDWTFDGTGKKLLGTIARDTEGLHTAATVVTALATATRRCLDRNRIG